MCYKLYQAAFHDAVWWWGGYRGCKGDKGYRPVVATLKELGLVIAYEFKAGNDNGGKLGILKQAFANMPPGKRIEEVVLDSEYYTNEVIEYLTDKGVRRSIAVAKDSAVIESYKGYFRRWLEALQ